MRTSQGLAIVTGGAGFIGAAMSSRLADTFDRVIAFDNLHPQIHPDHRPSDGFDPRVEVFEADITDATAWDRLLRDAKPDVVIHLAAETGTGQSLTESTRHTMVNVVGTSTMLDALTRNDAVPQRIVLASSRAVYGEGAWRYTTGPQAGDVYYPGPRPTSMFEAKQWDFPGAEPLAMNAALVQPRPASVYGVTKLAQEDLLRIWGDAFRVEIGIVRLQNVYGPGQTPSNPYTGIMSLFCRVAHNGEQISVYEDGEVRRDFIIIDDVALAILRMVQVDDCPTVPIDIGSGSFQTVGAAAELIASLYGAPAPQITGQWRHGDVRHAWADPEPARRLLGFSAEVGVDEGFRRLASWVDTQTSYL
ncbi:NAD-dependent epimerase/dehydratase family protein [Microbacterium hydrocarbonoxydans]|uniref:NAD-dependent epimerase/dehydratase family protein n=1 Tax=Microbacterium hydrocarbonoxydans TaxID=273678 RepID=UPI002041CC35|nr:NAD-dependent epimerase/dehydratase family protein [Microbacterium hydrocarbonoxydans]MCM3779312.1 NAD-dependent epimerase/dehydratase family protein [Microbacterium hydrocarbonoxydans]